MQLNVPCIILSLKKWHFGKLFGAKTHFSTNSQYNMTSYHCKSKIHEGESKYVPLKPDLYYFEMPKFPINYLPGIHTVPITWNIAIDKNEFPTPDLGESYEQLYDRILEFSGVQIEARNIRNSVSDKIEKDDD